MEITKDKRWGYGKITRFGKWFLAQSPEAWRVFEKWSSAAEWLNEEVERLKGGENAKS